MSSKQLYIAVSGGVDSSVAALIEAPKHDNVSLVHATCWDNDLYCSANDDRSSSVKLASFLGIPLTHLNLIEAYNNLVFQEFLKLLKFGLTPNPDVLCNLFIKFGLLLDSIPSDADLATGHYVSKQSVELITAYGLTPVSSVLSIPLDKSKDQSYYLCRIINREDILSRIIFPLSNLFKSEVRSIAKVNGIPSFNRPESFGFCFIGDRPYRQFISNYIKSNPGDILNTDGDIVGSHQGIHYYTIGQRKGFDLSIYTPDPLYIVSKSVENNTITVGNREKCMRNTIKLDDYISPFRDIHSISNIKMSDLSIRIRSLGDLNTIKCVNFDSSNSIEVTVEHPVFAPAPGQYGVIYYRGAIIGSGVITDSY